MSMDVDALLAVVCGGYVVIQSLRAFAWLIKLPRGAVLDAMLSSEVTDEVDLQEPFAGPTESMPGPASMKRLPAA